MVWTVNILKARWLIQYISFFIYPFKKTLLISVWKILNLMHSALILARWAKVSSQLLPSSWLKPWTTSLDLFLMINKFSSRLFLNINLVQIMALSAGQESSSTLWSAQTGGASPAWFLPSQYLSRPHSRFWDQWLIWILKMLQHF